MLSYNVISLARLVKQSKRYIKHDFHSKKNYKAFPFNITVFVLFFHDKAVTIAKKTSLVNESVTLMNKPKLESVISMPPIRHAPNSVNFFPFQAILKQQKKRRAACRMRIISQRQMKRDQLQDNWLTFF